MRPTPAAETPEAYAQRMAADVTNSEIETETGRLIEAQQNRRKKAEVGDIPVPPKYRSADFLSQDFWRLHSSLDVPKERFVSFPGCSPDADGSLVVTWAGYDHLARATAVGTFYQARKDEQGWPAERLTPLLAGLRELLPRLVQWHNDYNSAIGGGMGDYFADLVRDEARALGLTEAALAAWKPPAKPRKARGPGRGRQRHERSSPPRPYRHPGQGLRRRLRSAPVRRQPSADGDYTHALVAEQSHCFSG